MRHFVKMFAAVVLAAVLISFLGAPDWQRQDFDGGYILFRKSGPQIIEEKMFLNGKMIHHRYEDSDYRTHTLMYRDGEVVEHNIQ